jgi:hypothetical protein
MTVYGVLGVPDPKDAAGALKCPRYYFPLVTPYFTRYFDRNIH